MLFVAQFFFGAFAFLPDAEELEVLADMLALLSSKPIVVVLRPPAARSSAEEMTDSSVII